MKKKWMNKLLSFMPWRLINYGNCESEHFADKGYFAIVYILKCEENDWCGKKEEQDEWKDSYWWEEE